MMLFQLLLFGCYTKSLKLSKQLINKENEEKQCNYFIDNDTIIIYRTNLL